MSADQWKPLCAFLFIPSTGRRARRQQERKAKKPAALRRYLRATPVGQWSGRAIAMLSEAVDVVRSLNAFVSDPERLRQIEAQYRADAMSRSAGVDWYSPDVALGVDKTSPLTVGAEQTGRTIATGDWCATTMDEDE